MNSWSTIMAWTRKKVIACVVIAGLSGGIALVSVLRAEPGPGDPPVIVLPSARAAKSPVTQVQNTVPVTVMPPPAALPSPASVIPPATAPVTLATPSLPAPAPVPPKLEILPLPQPAPSMAPQPSPAPPMAPPLLPSPEKPLQPATPAPTLTVREPAKETAPAPRPETVAELPTPSGPTPSPLAPPGDSTMFKPALTAAAMTAAVMTAKADEPKKPDSDKTVAKADDVKALQTELDSLRKQLTALMGETKAAEVKAIRDEIESLKKEIQNLTAASTEASKATDLKLLKDEVAALKSQIATLNGKTDSQMKASDVQGLKDEIAALKKEITTLAAKPVDNKAMKDEVDALRKDVATLNTFLREALDGKVERGFTHDGLTRKVGKLDETVAALMKKLDKVETFKTPIDKPVTTPLPAVRGIVRVVNDYPVVITIVVNGTPYQLDPKETKDLVVAAGIFKYALGGANETERTIKENETVTLTIR